MNLYTIEQMQALERAADAAGHSYDAMMEQAGRAVAQAITELPASLWDEAGRRVLVLVGPGNNGGDGLVAARELARQGYSVVAYGWKRSANEPLVEAARRQGVSLLRADADGAQRLRQALARVAVVVDALFGTGLARPIAGHAAEILAALRAARAPRPAAAAPLHWLFRSEGGTHPTPFLVAVDVPSGLHGDSGEVDPATVPADLTVTFAGPKVGMLTPAAADVLGELVVADIGIPDEVLAQAQSEARLLTPEGAARLLPARPASGHKGTFGTTLVVGGSLNYVGAPALSALAAGRSGAGLVTLALPAPVQPLLATRPDLTTATWLALPHDLGVLREGALDVLAEQLPKADALVLGPGLGSEEPTQRFVWALLGLALPTSIPKSVGFVPPSRAPSARPAPALPPSVVDADGLNALAAWDGAWWEQVRTPLVLTPHPGEMGRLLARQTEAVQGARLATAREAAARFGQVVVLKGAFSVVAAPDGRASVAPYANDALAKAGAGDVLAGMIGALLGQGMAPYDAACLAVTAHGLAGEQVRRRVGGQGALASDLLDALPDVWQRLRRAAPRNLGENSP